MKVTAEGRVYVLGVTLCVALTICSRTSAIEVDRTSWPG